MIYDVVYAWNPLVWFRVVSVVMQPSTPGQRRIISIPALAPKIKAAVDKTPANVQCGAMTVTESAPLLTG
jgi:hypothetical protein